MKKIKLKMGITSLAITAVVIACVIIANAIVGVFVESNPMKIDLTKDKVYEFSDQTKDVMKNLDTEVKAYALFPESYSGETKEYVKQYLGKYKALNKNFKVEYVDPYVDTAFMDKYSTDGTQIDVGTVIIESGKNREIITADQLFSQNYFDDTVYIDMERRITNAVMLVTDQISEANIYFDVMHTMENYAQYGMVIGAFLKEEGYKCEIFDISTEGIPEDANIIVCIAPKYDYKEDQIKALNAFLERGGKFIIMGSEGLEPLENLDALLLEWGITINYDYVIEPDVNSSIPNASGRPVPIAKPGQKHTITEKLSSSRMHLIMPNTMSVSVSKSINGSEPTLLLTTSQQAYSKKELNTSNKEDGDLEGPLGLAAISIEMEEEASGIMVIGSFLGFANQILGDDGSYLNIDFLLNSLNYLSGSDAVIDIRAKQITPETMIVTQQQYKVINVVLVYIIPIVIILLGLVIWLRRRFK